MQNTCVINMADRYRARRQKWGEKSNRQCHLMDPWCAMNTGIAGSTAVVVKAGITKVKIRWDKAKLLKGPLQKVGTGLRNRINKDSGP